MPKPSHRDKLLREGLRVVHAHGFGGASVRDIVEAAGVPRGSFTNHFPSKQDFGLEVVALYRAEAAALMRRTLGDEARPPLARLHAWIAAQRDGAESADARAGCLLGNLSAEANDCGEAIRRRVVDALAEQESALAHCLRAAVAAGEIAADTDPDALAAFVLASLQGAHLIAKARRDPAPLARFEALLFERVLPDPRKAGAPAA